MIPENKKPEAVIEVNQYHNKKIAEENLLKAINVKTLFSKTMTDFIKLNKKAVKHGYAELKEEEKNELDLSNELVNKIIELMKEYSEKIVAAEDEE